MSDEYLLLKWGTLKGWRVTTDASRECLRRYHEHPVSLGVMTQRDTDTQRQALCDLIDAIDGSITNDWSGEDLTKEEAKDYVRNYERS